MDDELTLREAGELLGVTHKRVQGMIRQGQLTAEMRKTPVGTSYQVVKRADVEELARKREALSSGTMEKKQPGPKPRVPKASQRGPF